VSAPDPVWGAEASPPTRGRRFAYQLAWYLVKTVCTLPTSGAYVLAPTHRSGWDIPLASLVTRRRVRFMGKASVYKIPVLRTALRYLGGFPVQRGTADRVALQAMLDCLAGGEPVVVYPEGTRQAGQTVGPVFDGSAWVAARAEVPLVPVGIAGSGDIIKPGSRRPRFPKVVVVVGHPVPAVPRDGGAVPRARVKELTARLHDGMQAALDEAHTLRGDPPRG
jgi:1-acyl-sn-glycerol-3-phosphate acyltransferase